MRPETKKARRRMSGPGQSRGGNAQGGQAGYAGQAIAEAMRKPVNRPA